MIWSSGPENIAYTLLLKLSEAKASWRKIQDFGGKIMPALPAFFVLDKKLWISSQRLNCWPRKPWEYLILATIIKWIHLFSLAIKFGILRSS